MATRKPYPSDVSDEEWTFVAPYLGLVREDAPQRNHDLREVLNGLRWVVRTGSPWRYLPHDLPPWEAVLPADEAVAFRGAIDSHVRHPGEDHGVSSTIYGIVSAIFVSVLWGLWHHPILPSVTLFQLLFLQVLVGPFLSLFWRRSGNLMVPGSAHALSDSVRNALGLIP
jgi:transposase